MGPFQTLRLAIEPVRYKILVNQIIIFPPMFDGTMLGDMDINCVRGTCFVSVPGSSRLLIL